MATPQKWFYDRTSFIVIVDDDETLLKFFKIHFNKFFSHIIVVPDGKEAIKTLKEKTIDMVISDIRMPKIDGIELMEKVRRLNPTIPVLLVTGEVLSPEQEKAVAQADGFLRKPFDIEQLNEFIKGGLVIRECYNQISSHLKNNKNLLKVVAPTTSSSSPPSLGRLVKASESVPVVRELINKVRTLKGAA